jgi:hypothetical protein
MAQNQALTKFQRIHPLKENTPIDAITAFIEAAGSGANNALRTLALQALWFYVKAEFGKIHTTLFLGAKELTASVKCAPTSHSCGRLAAPLPSTEKAKSGHLRRENGVDSNQDFDSKHVLSVVKYCPGILVSVRLLLSNKASLSMFFSNLYTQ